MRRPLASASRRLDRLLRLSPIWTECRRLYEAGDRAPYGSAERAELYRQAALAQRQAEAAAELERVTSRRRKAA